jgi:hypothetical protein
MARSPQVRNVLCKLMLSIFDINLLNIVMDYHVSDSDKLFKLLSNPLLEPKIIFVNGASRNVLKLRRIIALYCRNSLDPVLKSFGCILPDDMSRPRMKSYEDWYNGEYRGYMTCSGYDCDQCNPPGNKIRYLIIAPEVIKSLSDEDVKEIYISNTSSPK